MVCASPMGGWNWVVGSSWSYLSVGLVGGILLRTGQGWCYLLEGFATAEGSWLVVELLHPLFEGSTTVVRRVSGGGDWGCLRAASLSPRYWFEGSTQGHVGRGIGLAVGVVGFLFDVVWGRRVGVHGCGQ